MKNFLFAIVFFFFVSNAFAQSFSNTGLDKLLTRAKETHSDAVVVMKGGKIVGEWYSTDKPEKIELMSCTKAIVGLIVGKLIDEGKIKSLDQSVSDFYPEWKQGQKKLITIKHLLNHTSGLQNVGNTSVEIYPSPDIVRLALAAELSYAPGTRFSYNNKAVNLLAGIVEKATGKRLDVYANEEFFKPLVITDFDWMKDKAGNPHAFAGLQLKATDFIKFGQLVLNKGMWNGKQIVSQQWINQSFAQSQPFEPTAGLLWFLEPTFTRYTIDDDKIKELEAAGFDKSVLEKLLPLKRKIFNNRAEYRNAITTAFGDNRQKILSQFVEKGYLPARKILGEMEGYSANGTLGQYIVIYPKYNLVAVRQITWKKPYNEKTDSFEDFIELVRAIGE